MINLRCWFFALILFAMVIPLDARGKKEAAAVKERSIVQVTGRVRLVGSSLFPEIVITGTDKEWYIAAEDRDKLFDLQHRTVTVEGEETVTELTFASGLPAGTRWELREIKVIVVQ